MKSWIFKYLIKIEYIRILFEVFIVFLFRINICVLIRGKNKYVIIYIFFCNEYVYIVRLNIWVSFCRVSKFLFFFEIGKLIKVMFYFIFIKILISR